MRKFKLPRKRKIKYKKDLAKALYAHWIGVASENTTNKTLLLGCGLMICLDKNEIAHSEYKRRSSMAEWEWFYFKRRVEIKRMETILTYPEYDREKQKYEFDPRLAKPATNNQLLEYYKENYPNDKIAHHFCLQNRRRWDRLH